MEALKIVNLGLAFLLELVAVGAYAYFGFHLNQPTIIKVLVGVGMPIVIVIAWAIWAAPTSPGRLHIPWLLIFKAAVFAGAALALHASGKTSWGVVFLLLFVCNETLAVLWGQEQPGNHK